MNDLLDAEVRGLEAAAAALQPALPVLDGEPFAPAELERLIDLTLLDSQADRARGESLSVARLGPLRFR